LASEGKLNPYIEMRFLRILKEGRMNISHLQQKANVNPKMFKKYVIHLGNSHYIEISVEGRFKKVIITDKGIRRLNQLENILNADPK